MQHALLAKSPWMKWTSATGSIGSMSSAMIVPSMPPSRTASRRLPCASLLRAYWLQLPRRAQIDDHLARADQLVLLVDFLQLVRGACAVPFPLRHFDVRVVDVVVQPGLVKAVLCHAMERLLPIAS
ncbi:hypothetical protein SZ29_11285 [Burkholderia pseudomallei]|nr:hypothetical protein SZ29_11285 [Burkholderia pseudomallei]